MSCKASYGIKAKTMVCLQMGPSSVCHPSFNAPLVGGECVLEKLLQTSSWPSIGSEATWLSQVVAVLEHGQRCPLPMAHVCVWIFILAQCFSTV